MTRPDVSPQQCVHIVANLLLGEHPSIDETAALCLATSPHASWRTFDRSIRREVGSAAWQQASAADVTSAVELAAHYEPEMDLPKSGSVWVLRPAVLQVLTSHPNGLVRLEAVRSLDAARRPLAIMERTLDWVPAVRAHAAQALATYWRRHPSDSAGIMAAHTLLERVAAIGRCPLLIPLAIDMVASPLSDTKMRTMWTHERRRRVNELLRNVRQHQCDQDSPEQEAARALLIEFHESRMRFAS